MCMARMPDRSRGRFEEGLYLEHACYTSGGGLSSVVPVHVPRKDIPRRGPDMVLINSFSLSSALVKKEPKSGFPNESLSLRCSFSLPLRECGITTHLKFRNIIMIISSSTISMQYMYSGRSQAPLTQSTLRDPGACICFTPALPQEYEPLNKNRRRTAFLCRAAHRSY